MQPELGPVLYLRDGREVKHGIRRNFARRVRSYDRHAGMQRRMAHGLVAVVGVIGRARRILEIGCGTGYLTQLLRQANPEAQLIALDLDASLVETARRRLGAAAGVAWLVADGEVPLRGAYDLIIANATFQWFTRPGRRWPTTIRASPPVAAWLFPPWDPGLFGNWPGPWARPPEPEPLELPQDSGSGFWRPRDLGKPLVPGRISPGAIVPGNGHHELSVGAEFLKTLQATGVTNPRPSPFSPRLLHAMIAAYQAVYGKNGAIPVSYEMIWAVAEKG